VLITSALSATSFRVSPRLHSDRRQRILIADIIQNEPIARAANCRSRAGELPARNATAMQQPTGGRGQ
jgi:hypothetical protein